MESRPSDLVGRTREKVPAFALGIAVGAASVVTGVVAAAWAWWEDQLRR